MQQQLRKAMGDVACCEVRVFISHFRYYLLPKSIFETSWKEESELGKFASYEA